MNARYFTVSMTPLFNSLTSFRLEHDGNSDGRPVPDSLVESHSSEPVPIVQMPLQEQSHSCSRVSFRSRANCRLWLLPVSPVEMHDGIIIVQQFTAGDMLQPQPAVRTFSRSAFALEEISLSIFLYDGSVH